MISRDAIRIAATGLIGLSLGLGLAAAPALAKSNIKVPPECRAITLERPMRDDEIIACFGTLMAMLEASETGAHFTFRNGPNPDGSSAAPGVKGPTGDAGPDGAQGEAGAKGSTGAPGQPGAPGASGQPGSQGQAGDQGAPGDQGPVGDKGPTGDKGETGTAPN